jgi:hypothetical protein
MNAHPRLPAIYQRSNFHATHTSQTIGVTLLLLLLLLLLL